MMIRGPYTAGMIVCLLLAGCHSGLQQAGTNDDPLRGGPLPAASAAAGPAGPAAQPAASGGAIPPIPAPTGSTSLAALTAGVQQSLDSETPLRIPATPVSRQDVGPPQGIQLGQPQPVVGPSAATPAADQGSTGFPTPGEEAPVSLTAPVLGAQLLTPPPDVPVAANVPVPDPAVLRAAAPGDNASGSSTAELQQALDARGVTWQHLERVASSNEWLFICSVPDPHDPDTVTKFRGIAAGVHGEDDGGQAAIRGVIAQIDQSRQH
jgi:hypothetical protein